MKFFHPSRFVVFYGVAAVLVGVFLLLDVWLTIDYRFWANVALLAIALLVNVFTFRYAFWSNWRANRIGRIYLNKCLVLSLVLDQIVLASWWDAEYPGRQHVRFAVYALGAVVYVPMVISLWQEQRKDRRHRREWLAMMPPPRRRLD